MSAWKKSFLYLTRKKTKNLIMLFITFLLGFLAFIAIGIKRNCTGSLQELQKSFSSSFVVTARQDWNNDEFVETTVNQFGITKTYIGPAIDRELIDEIASMNEIKSYNSERSIWLCLDELEIYPGSWFNHLEASKINEEAAIVPTLGKDYYIMRSKSVPVYGNDDTQLNQYFRTGAFELIDGRHIHPDDYRKATISDYIADKNGLKIGDTIAVSKHYRMFDLDAPDNKVSATFDLEIVGIFRVRVEQPISYFTAEEEIAQNYVYVDHTTCKEAITEAEPTYSDTYSNAVFFVKDPAELDAAIENARKISSIDWRYFDIKPDNTLYKTAQDSLSLLNMLSTIILVVIVFMALILLNLLLKMSMRERTHETGILLSLGYNKKQIKSSFYIEGVVIVICSLFLAFLLAGFVSKVVNNKVLEAVTPEKEVTEVKSKEELEQEIVDGTFKDKHEIVLPSQMPEQFNATISLTDFMCVALMMAVVLKLTTEWAIYKELSLSPHNLINRMK
ncbi:ABC transporter permease [Anaerolentibacter hominis]|uniref:ABC transporter permease n=1 Tax=Anaerolentibacter hominis TaxID=3079009 RepID=UPI0031B800B6